jgi:hypothetical protein
MPEIPNCTCFLCLKYWDLLTVITSTVVYAKFETIYTSFYIGFTQSRAKRDTRQLPQIVHVLVPKIVDPLPDITPTVVYAKLYTILHFFCFSFTHDSSFSGGDDGREGQR